MFKLKNNLKLPAHISYYRYTRDLQDKIMSEEDKTAVAEFYKSHHLLYEGLPNYQQNITFKRTVNYIYIVAHFYDNKDYAKMRIPEAMGQNGGIGVVRTRAYVFYKSGELLYELDHDYQTYSDNQIEEKKLNKRNYELHELCESRHRKQNCNYLDDIGNHSQNFIRFDKACHELLKQDNVCKSVDFITED